MSDLNRDNKKRNSVRADHLINFVRYERPKDAAPQRGRSRKGSTHKPYSKERFVQANFRFVVTEGGNYNANLRDPDLLVDWNRVEQVRFLAHNELNCPICLGTPIAAKISKCGHVFCWSCIIRHLSYGSSKLVGKCPICFEFINLKDLRSVVIQNTVKYEQGDNIRFQLVKRSKGSMIPLPRATWRVKTEAHPSSSDETTLYARFTLTPDISDILQREENELTQAAREAASEQDDSLPYIFAAQELLQERKEKFLAHQVRRDSIEGRKETDPQNSLSDSQKSLSDSQKSREEDELENPLPSPPSGLPKVSWDPFKYQSHPDVQRLARHLDDLELKEEIEALDHDEDYDDEEEEDDNGHPVEGNEEKMGRQGQLPALLSSSPYDSNMTSANLSNYAPSHNNNNQNKQADLEMYDDEFFYMYQAVDGQQSILHPLDCKILLREYGSIQDLPEEIEGKILELEELTQSEAFRKRHKYLSHIPLDSSFELIEVDLRKMVSRDSLKPFQDEIFKRHRKREGIRRRIEQEKRREIEEAHARKSLNILQPGHFPAMEPVDNEDPYYNPNKAEVNPSSTEDEEDEELAKAMRASLESTLTEQEVSELSASSPSFVPSNTVQQQTTTPPPNNNNNNNNSKTNANSTSVWGNRTAPNNNNNNNGPTFVDAVKSKGKPKPVVGFQQQPIKKGKQLLLLSNNSARRYN